MRYLHTHCQDKNKITKKRKLNKHPETLGVNSDKFSSLSRLTSSLLSFNWETLVSNVYDIDTL